MSDFEASLAEVRVSNYAFLISTGMPPNARDETRKDAREE